MQRLLEARLTPKLAFLGTSSRDQVLRYLRSLEARQYAPGTIQAVITVSKRLFRHLSQPRQSALAANLSEIAAQDITDFVRLAQGAGLAASTVNLSLSMLAEFFDFLRDDRADAGAAGQQASPPPPRTRDAAQADARSRSRRLLQGRRLDERPPPLPAHAAVRTPGLGSLLPHLGRLRSGGGHAPHQ